MELQIILAGLQIVLLTWVAIIGIITLKDKEYNDKRDKKLQMQVCIILMLNAILAPCLYFYKK